LIGSLLRDYCGEYDSKENQTTRLNVALFLIYSLTDCAAKEAIREILPEEGRAILEEISKKRKSILGTLSDSNQIAYLQHKITKFFED
jgi:hypothetical protein